MGAAIVHPAAPEPQAQLLTLESGRDRTIALAEPSSGGRPLGRRLPRMPASLPMPLAIASVAEREEYAMVV